MIPGLFWITDGHGQGTHFQVECLRPIYRSSKKAKPLGPDDPDRSSERALVRATALTVILGELLGLSWESWQTWVGEAMSLLAQGAADDERWRDDGGKRCAGRSDSGLRRGTSSGGTTSDGPSAESAVARTGRGSFQAVAV